MSAKEPSFDGEREEMLRDVHNELFGTERNPERGLLKRFEAFVARLEPVARAFEGAKWPMRIIITGLGLALTGAVVDFLKSLPTILGWAK